MEIEKLSHIIIQERLHINTNMDRLTDYLYDRIKGKTGIHVIKNNVPELDIDKVIFDISKKYTNTGELSINKSYKGKNGWVFYVYLTVPFFSDTVKHEMDHALRLMVKPREDILNNLNFLKSKMIFKNENQIDFFFYMIYLSSDEEINSMIKESYGDVREFMKNNSVSSLNRDQFIYIIKTTRPFLKSEDMINFNLKKCFASFTVNQINKLFYIYENNKRDLDRINRFPSFLRKIKLIIKGLRTWRSLLLRHCGGLSLYFRRVASFSPVDIENTDSHIYPKSKFDYEKYIKSQGYKLRRSLYKLYDHFT